MRRLIVRSSLASAVAAVLALVAACPAGADGAGGAVTDGDGVDFGAIAGGSHGGHSASSGSSGGNGAGPVCEYRYMGAGADNLPIFDLDGNLIEVTPGGAWYEKSCDGNFYGAVYLQGPPDAVDPAALAAGVLERITVPVPQVALSPAGDQVVNLASWLWIPNWAPLSGTATAGGVTVTVTVRPTAAKWTFGDGTTSSCAPGVAWTPGAARGAACTHVWKRSSTSQAGGAYRLSVSVTWTASFTVTGGAGGGALDPIVRTTTVPVRVGEVQALNNSRGG